MIWVDREALIIFPAIVRPIVVVTPVDRLLDIRRASGPLG